MAVIDLVKWDGPPDAIVWKYRSEELSTWTQLVVNESQEAYLVKGGVFEGPFGAGRHTLTTENIPLLRQVIGLPFGGKSPFSAEVWFVNKTTNLTIKWGTPDPIQLQDPKFGVMVPVRAFGQYGIQVSEGKLFLNKLVGIAKQIDPDFIARYLNGELVKHIKSAIASTIIEKGVPVLEASTKLIEISTAVQEALQSVAGVYGISIPQFNVLSINVPEDDPAIISLRNALAKRTEMMLLGTNYQQMRSLDVLEAAASNPGVGGSLMTAGIGAAAGLGMGTGMGAAMGALAGELRPKSDTEPASTPPAVADPMQKIQLIKELAELKNSGVLTEEEFTEQKKKILGD
jgi:membrane protease subunit (stomatin/prohibitin family)